MPVFHPTQITECTTPNFTIHGLLLSDARDNWSRMVQQ